MSANERIISQMVEILAYDFNNKYHQLKNNGLNQTQINKYMEEYQKSRNQIFKDDLKHLYSFTKK
jgi:hypothetical protein